MTPGEITTIYGESDDLIEFEGDYVGEVSCYGTDEEDMGVIITVSDGTVLHVKYGMRRNGVWGIDVLRQGDCYDSYEACFEETDSKYSDRVTMRGHIEWAYASKECELIN